MTELGFFKHAAILLILTVAATGCNNEKPDAPDQNERLAVNLIADIKPSTLKVAYDQWEENDKVGLFMKKGGQTITATGAVYIDAANVQMSISEQALTTETPVLYPASGNVDFIAYYPYTETAENDYTIAVNVADQTEALPVELLYSNNAVNQKPTEDPVMLNFQYSLAKLEITVKGGANSTLTATDFAAMTASIEGMNTQANLNLTDGTFAGKHAKEAITLRKTGSTNVTATFEALVLPTTAADGVVTFLFTVGDKTYLCQQTTNYASGKLYDLHFAIDFSTVNEPKATLLNASITPRTKITENYVINAMTQQIDDIQLHDLNNSSSFKFVVYTTIAGGMDEFTVEYDVDENFNSIVNILYTQINQADCYCQIPTTVSLDNGYKKAVISVKVRTRTGGTEDNPEFSDYRFIDSKEVDLPGSKIQIYWIQLKEITDEDLVYDVFTIFTGAMWGGYTVEYKEAENNTIEVDILQTHMAVTCYCASKTTISIRKEIYQKAIISVKVRTRTGGTEDNPEFSDYRFIDSKEFNLPNTK